MLERGGHFHRISSSKAALFHYQSSSVHFTIDSHRKSVYDIKLIEKLNSTVSLVTSVQKYSSGVFNLLCYALIVYYLQWFDAVDWAAGRASGL